MTKHRNTDIVIGEYPDGTDTFNLNQPKALACYVYATNTIMFNNWCLEQNRQHIENHDLLAKVLSVLQHEILHQAIAKIAGVKTSHQSHNLNIKYRRNLWNLV